MIRRAAVASLGLFPLLSLSVAAQDSPPSGVTKNLVCDRGSTCGFGYINGRKYETLASGNVGIVVTVGIVGKYLGAKVSVVNDSAGNVDVLPSNFVMTELAPKAKQFKPVDIYKLLRSAGRRMAWGNAMIAAGGSMARQQSTTTTNSTGTVYAGGSDGSSATGIYNGTSTSRTSAPDYAAQARAAETIQARNQSLSDTYSVAERVVLRANTVLPNQSVNGIMIFERDKKATTVMLSGIVGDTIYQFPFDLTVP